MNMAGIFASRIVEPGAWNQKATGCVALNEFGSAGAIQRERGVRG